MRRREDCFSECKCPIGGMAKESGIFALAIGTSAPPPRRIVCNYIPTPWRDPITGSVRADCGYRVISTSFEVEKSAADVVSSAFHH